MGKEFYSILEVANLLEITTQAVYKRLQQDKDKLDPHVEMVSNKKSLSIEGINVLCELMSIPNPLEVKEEPAEEDNSSDFVIKDSSESANADLVNYLKTDNRRLRSEIDELKNELSQARALREDDKKHALEERREHEEARKRTDTLLMQAIMNQESIKKIEENQNKPNFFERIFGKKSKESSDSNSEKN